MIRTKAKFLKLVYMFFDFISIQVSYIITTHILKNFLNIGIASSLKGTFFILIISVFCSIMFTLFYIYNYDVFKNIKLIKKYLLIAILLLLSVLMSELLICVVNNQKGMGFFKLAIFYVICFFGMIVVRSIITFAVLNTNKSRGVKILFIGASNCIEKYCIYLRNNNYLGAEIVGYVSKSADNRLADMEIKYKGSLLWFVENIENEVIDEVVVDYRYTSKKLHSDILIKCKLMGIRVTVLTEPYLEDFEAWEHKINEAFPAVSYSIAKLNHVQLFLKGAIDALGGLIGSLIFVILYIVIAPLIKIDSKGPVLFKQKRVGRNGRKFIMIKFRTMCIDAEAKKVELMNQNKMSGQIFKIDKDPRVTRIGGFLRKTSLDEFPQFINVLKGEMSLVGTRPPTLDEVENYEDRHFIRLSMMPGLTGRWQVSGRSDILDFEKIVQMDKEYIESWTIWQDIRIIFKTIVVLFKRKSAC